MKGTLLVPMVNQRKISVHRVQTKSLYLKCAQCSHRTPTSFVMAGLQYKQPLIAVCSQRTRTSVARGAITVWLPFSLTGLDCTKRKTMFIYLHSEAAES